MNRRKLLAATAGIASVVTGSTLTAREQDVPIRLNSSIHAASFRLQRTSGFRWDSVTPQEAMYLGIMSTWDEVSFDMVQEISAAVDRGGQSAIAAAATESSGGIHAISADVRLINPPSLFADAHEYFQAYVRHLAKGVDSLVDWGSTGRSSYVSSAIESLDLAADTRRLIVSSLPYPLPDRNTMVP